MSTQFEQAWNVERRRLIGLAEHILGDPGQAEDAVQEAFTRLALARDVESPAAWLTTTTSRICFDHLKSAATRREIPAAADVPERYAPDPADRVTLDESVRTALIVLLDRLSPEERVSFLLHDVFAMGFKDIAEVTGQSHAAVRQLASRGRRRLAAESPVIDPGGSDVTRVVDSFLAACRTGNLQALVTTLNPQAWGAAVFTNGLPPIRNKGADDVARTLLPFLRGQSLIAAGTTIFAFRDGRCFATLRLTIIDGGVQSVEATVEPVG
ncbi:sigma-70 family RNA polymerase sigma factor [Smaragdicoccus niigatensis]|uniref:sigma-70 family RNA polymerase sigma factor n=1 Tax=Smaragdicoccus niigatensis TaxID=359359 RepID=UPI00037B4E18|nr:sigma-70 family RNA polymerase sigma factor [Smaragdicoccus niigatensis]